MTGKTQELMSINEAIANGICLLRKPVWAFPEEHIKIDIVDGQLGPWIHLYSPSNMTLNRRNPVNLLIVEMELNYGKKEWVPFQYGDQP